MLPASRPQRSGVAAAEPAFVIAHAVIDHLRMELEQIEIQQRHVVLAAVHLGLDAVAAAGPIELVMPFAEQAGRRARRA